MYRYVGIGVGLPLIALSYRVGMFEGDFVGGVVVGRKDDLFVGVDEGIKVVGVVGAVVGDSV